MSRPTPPPRRQGTGEMVLTSSPSNVTRRCEFSFPVDSSCFRNDAHQFATQTSRVVGQCQSGRRRRAHALTSVRRSNCTCRFPAYSFHEDAPERGRGAKEGMSENRLTKPNSSYSVAGGNCFQPVVRHRRKRCDQIRRTIQRSSRWKSVRTWARL